MLRAENLLIHKVNRAFYNDVNDHLQFVLQTIEICRETLSSLVDLYISNNDLRMNDIMKRLTIVSTIFIPLTFLVGVWGNELQMDARTGLAVRIFICLDYNGGYRYYCIFVLQKKEMVLTKAHPSMKSIKELYRIGTGPSSSHTMGPRKALQKCLLNVTRMPHLSK